MLSAPHLPLALEPHGLRPPTARVVVPAARSTAWLRAPEKATTLGEARAIGESAEAARVLGQSFRGRFSSVVAIAGAEAAAIRWMATGLPLTVLDPRRPADSKGLDGEDLAVLAVAGAHDDALFAAIHSSGLDDRRGWVAAARRHSELWTQAARWGGRLSIPDWATPSAHVTSAVGFLLAEWAGIDSVRLAAGAREVDDWCAEPDPGQNPASWLARDLAAPVALFVERASLGPAAEWAASAAAERGRVIAPGELALGWAHWTLVGPDAEPPVAGLEIRVDPSDPAAWGAWCALVERALDQAEGTGPPAWYGPMAEAP